MCWACIFTPAHTMKLLGVVRGHGFGFISYRLYNADRRLCEFMPKDGAKDRAQVAPDLQHLARASGTVSW